MVLRKVSALSYRRQIALGCKAIRVWDNEVTQNINGVILAVIRALETKTKNNSLPGTPTDTSES